MDVTADMSSKKSDTCMFSFQHTSETFERIKNNFKPSGSHLEIIPEDRYDDVIDFLTEFFLSDEPVCAAFGIQKNTFSARILGRLRSNLSIMAVSDQTKQIVGVFVCDSEKEVDVDKLADQELKDIITFFSHKKPSADLLDSFEPREKLHLWNLAVHRNYRSHGLGSILVTAVVSFAKGLGFKALTAEATTHKSQHLLEKHGFQTITELPYHYKYKDGYLSDRTGEETSCKIYRLVIS